MPSTWNKRKNIYGYMQIKNHLRKIWWSLENILVIYFTFLSDNWLLQHSIATTMSFATTLIVQQITQGTTPARLFAIGIMIPMNSFNSSLPSYSFCSYRGKYSWPRIGQKCFLYLIWNSCQYYNRHFYMMSYHTSSSYVVQMSYNVVM